MTNTPRIYVADLEAYNNAILYGAWIDATDSIEEIHEQVSTMLKNSPIKNSEEWAIHDYECFGSQRLSEYESLETVHEIAKFLADNPVLGDGLLSHFGDNIADAERAHDEYLGCYTSLADYAEELTEGSTSIPESLQFYINYEAMARDMELNGDIFTIETAHDEVHVFLNF